MSVLNVKAKHTLLQELSNGNTKIKIKNLQRWQHHIDLPVINSDMRAEHEEVTSGNFFKYFILLLGVDGVAIK